MEKSLMTGDGDDGTQCGGVKIVQLRERFALSVSIYLCPTKIGVF